MTSTGGPGHLARRMNERINRRGLRPRDAAYLIIAVWLFWIVVFAVVERLVDPKTFGNVWEGIWWGAQTVTTVGYGDVVPQDTAGKAIAVILMLGGLSLIAVLTGAITSTFVTRAESERMQAGDDPVMQELQKLSTQLEELRAEIARGGRSNSD